MLTYPQIDPVAIAIGPLSVHWYGLMYLLAFGLFMLLGRAHLRRRPELGWTSQQLDDLLFYGVLGVVIGGRLGEILFYQPGYYFSHPAELIAIWKGGMSFHGGFLGVLSAIEAGAHRVTLKDAAGAVTATVSPDEGALALDVIAVSRPLPVFSEIPLDTYQLLAKVSEAQIEVTQFGASAMGGKLTATGAASWSQAGSARVDAKLELGGVDATQLLKELGSQLRLSGALSGTFSVAGQSVNLSQIQRAELLEGRFSIVTGTLAGFDFGAALRERGTGKIQGGETRFDTLAGSMTVGEKGVDVSISALDAGALDGRGQLLIGLQDELSGRVSASVSAGGRRVRLPVDISGSLTAPVLEVRLPDPPPPPPPAETTALETSVQEAEPPITLEGAVEVPVQPGDLR